MKYRMNCVVILFSLFLYSCEDLNEEVFSSFTAENYFQTEEHLLTAANGMYESFRHVWWDMQAYSLVVPQSRYFTSRLNTGLAVYQLTPSSGELSGVWGMLYRCINRANGIIKYAPNSNASQKVIDQHVAEARFMRAWSYFVLVRLFGDVPMHLEPVETLDDELLYKSREPINNIYNDLIIPDLIFAKDHMPKTKRYDYNTISGQPIGRVRAAAAYVLLGEVYITIAGEPLKNNPDVNYANAAEVLRELIDNASHHEVELLPKWMDIWSLSNEMNNEKLFAFGATHDQQYGSMLARIVSPRFSPFAALQGGNYEWGLTMDLVNSFETTDVRYTDGLIWSYLSRRNDSVHFNPTEVVQNVYEYHFMNGICSAKWQDGDATRNVVHHNDKIMMRYVEAYLLLAEAYCELNELSDARTYLNITRRRVNASEINLDNQSALREEIRMERHRELHFEFKELFDIRRWGTARENFENHLIKSKRNNPVDVWDDKFLLYPIPQAERDRYEGRAGMGQNPGW